MREKIIIDNSYVGMRLDKAVSMKDTSISRAAVQRMIDEYRKGI